MNNINLNIEDANVLYSKALKQVDDMKDCNYRLGQAIFNLLYDYDKDLANEIRGTELDMFHMNDKAATKILFEQLTSYEENNN